MTLALKESLLRLEENLMLNEWNWLWCPHCDRLIEIPPELILQEYNTNRVILLIMTVSGIVAGLMAGWLWWGA